MQPFAQLRRSGEAAEPVTLQAKQQLEASVQTNWQEATLHAEAEMSRDGPSDRARARLMVQGYPAGVESSEDARL